MVLFAREKQSRGNITYYFLKSAAFCGNCTQMLQISRKFSKVSILRQLANSFLQKVRLLARNSSKNFFLELAISCRRAASFVAAHVSAAFVSTNGLRRKTQLSRNQSLIAQVYGQARQAVNLLWNLFAQICFLSSFFVVIFTSEHDFVSRTKLQFSKLQSASFIHDTASWHARVHYRAYLYKTS